MHVYARPTATATGLLAVSTADAERLLTPGTGVRLVARLRRAALDRSLADGADPGSSPFLAARAAALTAPAARHALAARLDSLVADVQRPPRRHRVAPPRRSVLANGPALSELAAVLRGPAPPYARGLAMLTGLLTDGAGPLYAREQMPALAAALSDARTALTG